MIADLLLKLALVLVFAYLSVLALKRLSHRRGRLLRGGGSIRVLETTSLAPNRGLHLVAVGKRVLVIGSTPESISLLREASELGEALEQPEPAAEKPGFGSQLQAMFNRSGPSQGLSGVIASLRDGTFFMKRAVGRARELAGQEETRRPAVDGRG